jgi:hypothetical protein
MTKEDHQLDEMVNAIQSVIGVSETKGRIAAQQEVIALINSGLDKGFMPMTILHNLANWAGGEK